MDSSRDCDTALVRQMNHLEEPRQLCIIVRQLADKKVQVRFVKGNLTCIGDDTAHVWHLDCGGMRGTPFP
jgi:hypothetical protein